MTTKTTLSVGVLLIVAAAIGVLVIPKLRAQNAPAWINQDANWAANKEKLQAFGERFATSDAMYEALKQQAHGGKPPTWPQMAEPAYDWSGVYTRSKLSLHFDPDLPNDRRSCLREAHTGRSSRRQSQSGPARAHRRRVRPDQRLPSTWRAALVH